MYWDSVSFHHTSQNSTQFKTYEFISGIFHLLFLDHGWPQVIKTTESETKDKRRLLYFILFWHEILLSKGLII